MNLADVHTLNKAPPGYPVGEEIPPDAYLHMIVNKKYGIERIPIDEDLDDLIEEGSDIEHPFVAFRDRRHLGCRCTDIVFLIFYLIFLLTVIGLAVYLWTNATITLNDHGEKCKVFCYFLEIPKTYDLKEEFKCSKTNKYEVRPRVDAKFEIEDFRPYKSCLKDCNRFDDFEEFGHECTEQAGNSTITHHAPLIKLDSKLSELSFLGARYRFFLGLLAVPIVLTLIVLIFLLVFNVLFYWLLLIVSFLFVMGTTGFIIYLFLVQYSENSDEKKDPWPTMSVLFVLGWILFSLYWFFLLFTSVVKKQRKTIRLTKFAAGAVRCSLILDVIISMLALTLVYVLTIILSGAIETNGKFIYEDKLISYEKTNEKDVARFLLIFTYWWTNHLIISCQHLVVANIVATKRLYGKTIGLCYSNAQLMRYHLGTACMASFTFSTFSFIKDIYEAFLRIESVRCHPFVPSEYDVDYPKGGNCFKPISRVSYIPVCLFCEHFMPGGRKATYLFLQRHLINWRACKHYFVLIHAIMLAGTTFYYTYFSLENDKYLENMMYAMALSLIYSYFIAQAGLGLFRMIIDTLFFCYCYDLSLNNGKDLPYITDPRFMAFVKDIPRNVHRRAKVRTLKRAKPVTEQPKKEPKPPEPVRVEPKAKEEPKVVEKKKEKKDKKHEKGGKKRKSGGKDGKKRKSKGDKKKKKKKKKR